MNNLGSALKQRHIQARRMSITAHSMEPRCGPCIPAADGETDRQELKLVPFVAPAARKERLRTQMRDPPGGGILFLGVSHSRPIFTSSRDFDRETKLSDSVGPELRPETAGRRSAPAMERFPG